MNTTLHENKLEHYIKVYSDIRESEVSGELVVPDRFPDIGLVGDTNADAILRSKRVEASACIMEGDLQISIAYLPDGGEGIQALELNLPWQAEFQSNLIGQHGKAVGRVLVKRAETRMMNPRKILVKVQLLVELDVYENNTVVVYEPADDSGMVQTRTDTFECAVISTVCEKTFVATDEYPVPVDCVGGRIIEKTVQFRVDDVKTLSNKLIVKGSVISDVVICGPSGVAEKVGFISTFSFIEETETAQLSNNVKMKIIPTGLFYEMSSDGQILSVEVHAVCQMVAYHEQKIDYISDAYCNFYEYRLEKEAVPLYINTRAASIRETNNGKLICHSRIAHICFLTASLGYERDAGKMVYAAFIGAYVKYENGMYDWVRTQVDLPLKIKEGSGADTVRVIDIHGIPSGSEIEYRLQFETDSREEAAVRLEYVSEIIVDEEQPYTGKRPSLTVIRKKGELWELAKQCGSTVEMIRAYNELDEENEAVNQVLLIPKQRK